MRASCLNTADEAALTKIFKNLATSPGGAPLARDRASPRTNKRFETSDDLVGAIRAVLGSRSGAAEFARLFQALRIAVNDELPGLERALPVACEIV
jgi:16S rRNA (cytosine1402-N4)-methyltransferase